MGEITVAALSAWLIALSAFDIRHGRLPNALTLPGAAAILAVAVCSGHGLSAVLGATALFAVYAAVHLATPAAMGAGDVKLAVGLGALSGAFGPEAWLLAALGAPTFTTLVGLIGRRRTVPHGPSMCAATALAVAMSWPCLPLR
ncbi:A24 family peptidase [Mycolicibacterium sp. BiH015]|uniref:prepilin peptidase n=1 Tax=Mycolicibacterium sp. BiH015 TaxID=3018808 RepID=UPI0022DFF866|nr:A24 family peptidase [Mycolicibacterium sp. BiH015]MDA2891045.1 A24 family peptidase [Mycolicibacterium sp. BiH015]